MPTVVYQVQVGWRFEPPFWYETFGDTAYDDITGDVKSISIRRGRSSDMGAMQQGVCTIRLTDTTGKYNPENAASPLNGYLLPMRPVRVRATYNATTYTLFYGFISQISHDPSKGSKESTIEAVDASGWLDSRQPTIATEINQTIGGIATLIFVDMGLGGTWYDFDLGPVIPSWEADATKGIIEIFSELIAIDHGMLFVSGSGALTYYEAQSVYTHSAPAVTFTGAMASALSSTIIDDGIVNIQSVTRTGGVEQTANDADSGLRYGYRTGSAITSPYLASDAAALALAKLIIATKKDPQSPARNLVLWNADATRLVQMLTREIGDHVAVDETLGGTEFSGWIAGVEHDIWEGGKFHKTTFSVQKGMFFITLGTSTIGSIDIVG